MFSSIVATGEWAWTPSSGALLGEDVNRIEVDGKYYLVDIGYPPKKGYLGPYKEESGRQASGPHKIFNHAHSSLRSVIERTFGVWKNKWKIIKSMPSYPYDKQVKIVIATMTLHKFIRSGDKD
ncbi:DDE_4 domain-containing protein [Cephalotus follicularis]|uniref:DDE_4 domain-containing protein n=1 Tax=Cephalotus follicularis TaxID=3775 RepID=A0A1Q3C6M7_CEPFO|nr:DDE_4 domain-containing protein [Cephalotus follicularis]